MMEILLVDVFRYKIAAMVDYRLWCDIIDLIRSIEWLKSRRLGLPAGIPSLIRLISTFTPFWVCDDAERLMRRPDGCDLLLPACHLAFRRRSAARVCHSLLWYQEMGVQSLMYEIDRIEERL